MTEIDPASQTITDDIRRAIAEKAAVKRGETWERMGCPTAKTTMPLDQYERDFRGRLWFASKEVFEQAQQVLMVILCPKCIEEADYGAMKGTRFFITVEDDVMTVFPAVGHFLCHHCGFEEYHPMKHDPRVRQQSATSTELQAQQAHFNARMPGLGQLLGEYQNALQHKLANPIGQGISPGMGPIWGMTEEEKRSLHRLYQQSHAKSAPPPPIVQSKEEAELLLKLAPTERRQAIIQKLRDLGKI